MQYILKELVLAHNKFHGPIENKINNPLLEVLFLQGQKLTGSIPNFGKSMKRVALVGNYFSGQLNLSLPYELSFFQNNFFKW